MLAVADLETDGFHRDPFDRWLVWQLRSFGTAVIMP